MLVEADLLTLEGPSVAKGMEVSSKEKEVFVVCHKLGRSGKYHDRKKKDSWCHNCGCDFHINKNCPQRSESCIWCGMKLVYSYILHHIGVKDSHKRIELIKTMGILFGQLLMGIQCPPGLSCRNNRGSARGRRYNGWDGH